MMKITKQKQSKKIDEDADDYLDASISSIVYRNKVQQNSTEKKNGQSMFEFLKRRKKFALQNSIIKNRASFNPSPQLLSSTNKSFLEIKDKSVDRLKLNKKSSANDNQLNEQKYSGKFSKRLNYKFREQNTSVQPKYNNTNRQDKQNQDKNHANRSFYDIISPLRKKLSKDRSFYKNEEKQEAITIPIKFKEKQNQLQTQTLYAKIEEFSRNLEQNNRKNKNYLTRSASILAEVLDLFCYIQQICEDKLILKKIAQIRTNFKILEKLFDQDYTTDPLETLNTLNKFLREKLSVMQSHYKKHYEKQSRDFIKKREQQLNEKQYELKEQMKRLNKQLQAISKKSKKQKDIQRQNYNSVVFRQQQLSRNWKGRVKGYEQKIQQYQKTIKQNHERIKQLEENKKILQRQKKSIQYEKLALIKTFDAEKQSINAIRQNYLLQQISSIKKQFQVDINDIKNLYHLKQEQFIQQIERLQALLRQNQLKKHTLNQNQVTYSEEISNLSFKIEKLKNQNSMLREKFFKKDEELYSYWSALNDIKILSTRLGIFNKFFPIYQDIDFNDTKMQ